MADKFFDPPEIRALANGLDQVASEVDGVGRSTPPSLDAGPLTPWILELVQAAAANVAAQVIRLHAAAEAARQSAARYADAEDHHVETIGEFLRDLAGESPGGGGGDGTDGRVGR